MGAQERAQQKAQERALWRALKRASIHLEEEESEPCPVGACLIFFSSTRPYLDQFWKKKYFCTLKSVNFHPKISVSQMTQNEFSPKNKCV